MLRFLSCLGRGLLLCLLCVGAAAAPLRLDIHGLSSLGPQVGIAFDLVDGDGPSNQVLLSGFSTDGALALGAVQGDVSGALPGPFLLRDTQLLNSLLLVVSGADRFAVNFSDSGVPPQAGGFADSFAAYLVDLQTGLPLPTTDPSGSGALFALFVDGSAVAVYQPLNAPGLSWTVQPADIVPLPLPSTLALVGAGILALLLRRWRGVFRLAWLALACLAGAPVAAADLAGMVQVERSGFLYNRNSDTYDTTVTLRNISPDPVSGPLRLVLGQPKPSSVAAYQADGRLEDGREFLDVPLADGLLAPGARATVLLKLLNPSRQAPRMALSADGELLPPSARATLQVRAFQVAGEGEAPLPVGAGYSVRIDGYARGVTNAAGEATLLLPLSAQQVEVSRPPNAVGSAALAGLAPGEVRSVDVLVANDGEVYGDARLVLRQRRGLLLARGLPALDLAFQRNGQVLRLVALDEVSLVDVLEFTRDARPMAQLLADGSLRLAGPAFYGLAGTLGGRLRLRVVGRGADDVTYLGEAEFYLSDFRVRVQLVAPPSAPGAPLGGLRVEGELLNSDLRFAVDTDAQGMADLPNLPRGSVRLRARQLYNGAWLVGDASLALSSPVLARLVLRGEQDVRDGVLPLTTEPLPAAAAVPLLQAPASAADGVLRRATAAASAALPVAGHGLFAAADAVQASAVAAGQDAVVEGWAELPLAQGTSAVRLTYNVATAEYPYWVQAQSIFNDVWKVQVFSADHAPLFDISRQINSQLATAPVWRSDGTTGPVKVDIDATQLAAGGDSSMLLLVSATNIGDNLLATSVQATLEAGTPLAISKLTPDAINANNGGTYFSIPRSGSGNHFQRRFKVEVSKPKDATLESIRVEALDGAGAALMEVLPPSAPGENGVELVSQTDTRLVLDVRVTLGDGMVSSVAGTPPPATHLAYRFTVKALRDGVPLTAEKEAGGKRALWRMPDGVPRFSTRDTGGDDWSARGAYLWIEQHGDLLEPVNDISGEHGRNIGHATHARGTDIDTHHFYRFPGVGNGAGTGDLNYTRLAQNAQLAFQRDAQGAPTPAALQARGLLAAWVERSRSRITALAARPEVAQVIYCAGAPNGGLGAGWCNTLLRAGLLRRTLPGQAPETLQLVADAYTGDNGKLANNDVHNNHVHVTLSPPAIGE